MGCDLGLMKYKRSTKNFNPRTPYGVRHIIVVKDFRAWLFQSTHPVWGATTKITFRRDTIRISIHAPRMGCDIKSLCLGRIPIHFNPRTPYGVRLGKRWRAIQREIFQSTHPVWGATPCPRDRSQDARISIHAPRMGCDPRSDGGIYSDDYFNPRTPYGVRLSPCLSSIILSSFQSTHPVWGATRNRGLFIANGHISIHAPRMGCDPTFARLYAHLRHFNPRTPYGVRLTNAQY